MRLTGLILLLSIFAACSDKNDDDNVTVSNAAILGRWSVVSYVNTEFVGNDPGGTRTVPGNPGDFVLITADSIRIGNALSSTASAYRLSGNSIIANGDTTFINEVSASTLVLFNPARRTTGITVDLTINLRK